MLRRLVSLVLALAVVVSACAGDGDGAVSEEESSSSTSEAVATSSSTSTSSTSVVTTTAPSAATTTLPSVGVLVSTALLDEGLFCRDLAALGYDYVDAVAYWIRLGRPGHMDADGNGIPCETVYPLSEVEDFWSNLTSAITTPTPTPTRDPGILAAGLYCRDVAAEGLNFDQAVAYWMLEGMPARMDADGNGIPCETVYSSTDVTQTYGPDDGLAVYLVTTVGSTPIPLFEATGPAVDAGLICPSGTADWVNGHETRWEDQYVCDDGSGTFIAGADIHIMTNDRLYESWTIVSGTGAYANLTGGGGADTGPTPSGLWQDHMYGRISNPG